MSAPAHEIVIAQTPEEHHQCYDVRINVFIHEQGFPLEAERDNFDEMATHFLLRLTPSLVPIGTIRCFKVPDTHYYKLTRLAILGEYRRFGFGRELVQALHNWVKVAAMRAGHAGSVRIIAHAQIPVKAFYAKFGYQPEGDEFDEDGDPHQKMVLQLPLEFQ